MAYEFEWFQHIIYPLIDLMSILVFVFSIKTWLMVRKQHKLPETRRMLTVVFVLFTLAGALWAIAENGWSLWTWIAGEMPGTSFLDVFWLLGYPLMISAFIYFGYCVMRTQKDMRKGISTLVGVSLVYGLVTFYVLKTYLLPGITPASGFVELFVLLAYPILSALMVTSSTTVYLFFRKAESLRIPLLMLAVGAFLSYFGDILYAYYTWYDVYGWSGVISDGLYFIEYCLWTYAFYRFSSSAEEAKNGSHIKNEHREVGSR